MAGLGKQVWAKQTQTNILSAPVYLCRYYIAWSPVEKKQYLYKYAKDDKNHRTLREEREIICVCILPIVFAVYVLEEKKDIKAYTSRCIT